MALSFAASPGSKRMGDGRVWTTENLRVETAGSYCYGGVEANCGSYGRLYTWEAARGACAALGTGWRLPTDGDWRELAKAYGGIFEDSSDKGRGAYRALMVGGGSGFGAVLSGGRGEDGEYARLEAHGFYWTASEGEKGGAYYYNFGHGGLALYRQMDGEKGRGFAVRCVRE